MSAVDVDAWTCPHCQETHLGGKKALTFARGPREQEAAGAEKLVAAHGLPALCRVLLNANEFLSID